MTWYEALREEEGIDLMKGARGLPEVAVTLPVLKGFGQDELFGKIYQVMIDPNLASRNVGRTIGDIGLGPLLIFVGLGLTVAPNLKQNTEEGAPWTIPGKQWFTPT